MIAVGTYISTLRLAQGMTQQDVANAAGTTTTTIYRYEAGKQVEPETGLLFRVIDAVRGRADHIKELMLADNPTGEYARSLAKAQLTPEEREAVGQFFDSDEDTQTLLEAVYRVTSHNAALRAEIRGYVAGIEARARQRPPESPQPSLRRRRGARQGESKPDE